MYIILISSACFCCAEMGKIKRPKYLLWKYLEEVMVLQSTGRHALLVFFQLTQFLSSFLLPCEGENYANLDYYGMFSTYSQRWWSVTALSAICSGLLATSFQIGCTVDCWSQPYFRNEKVKC